MCGVFAISSRYKFDNELQSIGAEGVSLLRHRGPDNSSTWVDKENKIFLGHSRLSILDLTDNSSQPMESCDHVISFNGEIYNYIEVRRRLKGLGHTFKSQGDAEVLISAWAEWGEKSLDIIEGMFAAAIWNGTKLILISDPFGEKTLYYSQQPSGVFVSSELSTLVQLLKPRAINNQLLKTSFLLNGYIPAPNTAYQKTFF